jgi:DNA processing protein
MERPNGDPAMMESERKRQAIAALELTLIPELGTHTQERLRKMCPDMTEVFTLPDPMLESLGLGQTPIHALKARRYRSTAEEILDWCRHESCNLLVRGGDRYPPLLEEIHDPPLILYARGNLDALEQPLLAVVGTRRPTYYGLQMAEGLARDLGSRGVTVVSGLARGIDAAAHRGCEESGGKTIAVLGCGIDIVYPREHRQLTLKMIARGLVLTEFPPGTSPSPQNFPIRNRIISGLSLGTLIVEASEYSGSLITARLAMEQNRDVFALPGNLTSPQSFGPNFLIKQGAKLVQSWRDIVDEFPADLRAEVFSREDVSPPPRQQLELLTNDELKVMHLLATDEAIHFDGVLRRSGLEISRVSDILLKLEMTGQVRQVPGNLFIRIARPPKY